MFAILSDFTINRLMLIEDNWIGMVSPSLNVNDALGTLSLLANAG
uniref:Uncharacterized protein n=1 Tax=Vibrio sp. F12 FF_152 TaxID=1652829 RepID=A0A0H3ZVJ1_9VIBR|nr:hypothetical protein [Vibrio sp. F12 FF_152]